MNNTPDLQSVAEQFHVATRNRSAAKRNYLSYQIHYQPSVLRLVSDAPKRVLGYSRIPLPTPSPGCATLTDLLARRRSRREFSTTPITLAELSHMLVHGHAVRGLGQTTDGFTVYSRPNPNSGGLGAVEIYPVVLSVDGLDPGIYHFDSINADLALLHAGHYGGWLRHRAMFQVEYPNAAVVLVVTVAFGRLMTKYGDRGYRLGLLDAGHVSQSLYLLATELNLAVCASAGFVDLELDDALDIDGLTEATVLTVVVARPEGGR